MNNKIVSGIVIAAITTFIFNGCYAKNNTGFSKEASPYSKEEESNYSYEINTSKISISSNCSDLKITQSDTSEIKINMKKAVGGESEEKLQQALDDIKCAFQDNVINIGPENNDGSLANSRNVQATISIPADITSLNITSSVGNVGLEGNYDNFKAEMKTGDLAYEGGLKQCNIDSKVGNIKLNLHDLDSSYKYSINSKVGDIDITIPKENSINLTGSASKDINIQNGIKVDSSGATFDINNKVSHIKIHN